MLKFCKFVKSTPSFLAHVREEPAFKFQKSTKKVERRRAPPVAVYSWIAVLAEDDEPGSKEAAD